MPDDATTAAPTEGTTAAAPTTPTPWAANPSLQKFGGDAEKLAHSYLELEKSFSGRVRIPGDASTPEEVASFRKALGVPEKSDGYTITLPAAPEGKQADDSLLKTFMPIFHKAGLTNAQAQQIAQGYTEAMAGKVITDPVEVGTLRQENLTELEKAWGPAFKQEMAWGDKAVDLWGDEELKALWQDPTIGSNPSLRKFMSRIGKLSAEAHYVDSATVSGREPADIEKRIAEIRQDPAFWNDFGPNAARHAALVKELETLTQMRVQPRQG